MAKRKRLTPANPVFLDTPGGAPLPGPLPRGPAPIADVVRDASAAATAAELAEALQSARDNGRMIVPVALDAIRLDHLVRDRIVAEDEEMAALIASIRARGQQTPIEVVALEDGGYGLISGWRRCQALAHLLAETGEDRFASALALVRRPEGAAEAYQAMVEENEIRVGLSYYERARITAKSADAGVFETDREALSTLFRAASRAKRSKIGSFVTIVRALDGTLRFPRAIGERAGLVLARALDADPGLAGRIRAGLQSAAPGDSEAEQALIAALIAPPAPETGPEIGTEPAQKPPAPGPEELAPGLFCRETARGELVLWGPGLTPDRRAALARWLRDQG